ncbi:MAG TPA: Hsp70 family protein [Spirochaetota bacterium]|mgnify:CR=1 FL=1|nr:Hsp70 family protein [Spirochaetota bacterium]
MTLPKSIGIKLYDDTFVPVLSEQEIKNKRLVLTTVKDNQKKAIIELYEGTSDKCINNEYLGKLVVSIDRETIKGGPGIEVNLRLSEDGMLYAKAWDSESKVESEITIEHSASERIFKETLSNEEIDTMYDNDTKNIESFTEDDLLGNQTETNSLTPQKKDWFPIIRAGLFILIIAVLVALLGLGGFLLYKNVSELIATQNSKKIEKMKIENEKKKSEEENKKLEAEKLEAEKRKAEEEQKNIDEQKKLEEEKLAKLKKEEEERVLKEQMLREKERLDKIKKENEENKEKENIKGVKNISGKKHFIRKGDNLWNICKRYYKDPWYYPDLAQVNEIKNPRRIFAGKYMIIPDKSALKRWDFSK